MLALTIHVAKKKKKKKPVPTELHLSAANARIFSPFPPPPSFLMFGILSPQKRAPPSSSAQKLTPLPPPLLLPVFRGTLKGRGESGTKD